MRELICLNCAFALFQSCESCAREAREAFITGAGTLVMPIVSVDGRPVGDGKPGPVAERLRRLYIEEARRTAI